MDKQFPIILPFSKRLDKGPRSVPWALVAPHEAQALKNHGGQSLERLAERGGLSLDELVAVLEDRRWLSMPDEYALQNLQNHLDEFSKLEQEKLEYSDTYIPNPSYTSSYGKCTVCGWDVLLTDEHDASYCLKLTLEHERRENKRQMDKLVDALNRKITNGQ